MYQALYRTYRPKGFDELVGQDHVKQTLLNTLRTGRFSHAYLFSGPRGTGKTSIAKLMAKAVNCLEPIQGEPCGKCANCISISKNANNDVYEIDAASNNGVDEIRAIRENVQFAPSEGKYKVFIIDEVHMLSTGAFNALLKTLEEPPLHVLFILATTEPHKIPLTIISRCQRFDFRRITPQALIERMKYIANDQNIVVEDEALRMIAQVAQGGMRDALSLLDQTISFANGIVTPEHVASVVGKVGLGDILQIVRKIHNGHIADVLEMVETMIEQGKEPEFFLEDLIGYYRDLMIYNMTKDSAQLTTAIFSEEFAEIAKTLDISYIQSIIKDLMESKNLLKYSNSAKTALEISLVKLTTINNSSDSSQEQGNSSNIKFLEEQISSLTKEIGKLKSSNSSNVFVSNPHLNTMPPTDELDRAVDIVKEVIFKATKQHKDYLQARWNDILSVVSKKNIGTFRLANEGTIVLSSNSHCVLCFPTQKQAALAYIKMNNEAITEAVKEVIGHPLKVIYIDNNGWVEVKNYYMQNKDLKSS